MRIDESGRERSCSDKSAKCANNKVQGFFYFERASPELISLKSCVPRFHSRKRDFDAVGCGKISPAAGV